MLRQLQLGDGIAVDFVRSIRDPQRALSRAIAAGIASSLDGLEQLLKRTGRFDPGTSQRCFTVAMREANELSFLPTLIERLGREAPNVDVAIVRIDRRDLEEDLQSGEIDVALDVELPLSPDVRRELVTSEALAVLARKDHPSVQGTLTTDAYLATEHVLVTGRRRGGGYEDVALGRLGMSRRIRVRCQHYAAAGEVVARSDLLATMPRSQAEIASQRSGNQLLPFPAMIPPLEMFLYWHANMDDDPGSQWLRQMLLGLLRR